MNNEIYKDIELLYFETLQDLQSQINLFKKINPKLINNLQLDRQDPQAERMIKSFALIAASLRYDVEKRKEKEIISLVYNLFPELDFIFVPSGIAKVNFKNNFPQRIEKNSIIHAPNSIFRTKFDVVLNNIFINKTTIKKENGKIYLLIELKGKGMKNLSNVYFYTNNELIKSMFWNNQEIAGNISNREEYETKCEIKWINKLTILETMFFSQENNFFSVENIDNRAINDSAKIKIPLNFELENIELDLNCIPIENNFINNTIPQIISKNEEYLLHMSDNTEIRKINKVLILKGNETIELEHVSKKS